MGYGYGSGTHHSETAAYKNDGSGRAPMVFANSMVAHVWAQQTQDFGRSSNGNFYFRGRKLYSYGSHYIAGYIMPDGTALINGKSYSISTSGHVSDAGGATRESVRFYVDDLTKQESLLDLIARGTDASRIKQAARIALEQFAESFAASHAVAPGEWRSWGSDADSQRGESFGEYIARVAKLPAAAWPAARKRAEIAKAKAAKHAARTMAKHIHDSAVLLATQPAAAWDSRFKVTHALYTREFESLAKDLFHAKRYAKAHGFSAKRLDVLRQREKQVRAFIPEIPRLKAIYEGRSSIRYNLQMLASARAELMKPETSPSTRESVLYRAARSLRELAVMPIFSAATNRRLIGQAAALEAAREPIRAEIARLAEIARVEREAERQRNEAERAERAAKAKADWLAGVPDAQPPYFDAESGGAAMRVVGDELQTSWGARVPLAHAVKVFRFVKLCRERGQAWQRNGVTIRVGHFQVDSVTADGDFKAGCHNFTWPEVERAAAMAGVVDCPADDSAVESSH